MHSTCATPRVVGAPFGQHRVQAFADAALTRPLPRRLPAILSRPERQVQRRRIATASATAAASSAAVLSKSSG